MSSVLAIIGVILSVISIFLFFKSKNIKIEKNELQQRYLAQIQQLYQKKKNIAKELSNYQIEQLKKINKFIQQQKRKIEQTLWNYKQNQSQQIIKIDKDFEAYKQKKAQQKQSIQTNMLKLKEKINVEVQTQINKLEELKETINAGIQAQLREQERKSGENKEFYSLVISDIDLTDVEKLEKLKKELHNPVILSKLIWTQYFQKQMSSLCDRVLGKTKVCGIYKITDLTTQKCYIGQSVDIAERWKQHCKCGLGIEASATNTLYNTMQKHGVWNFAFELLEKCSKEQLNEKESFWINTYQSNIYGLNILKGNK